MYYRLLAILSDIFDYPQWLRQMHLPAWWTEGVKKGKVILKAENKSRPAVCQSPSTSRAIFFTPSYCKNKFYFP
ncbi:unnamed protein product [Allacma fusca]|uniref:Uncharacterized protein n=1 Tax=Allacma fusca TaxID=39272 RepID=A0A8J2PF47_9HEXA|nr:unnamed protein product [Allacma fusca]